MKVNYIDHMGSDLSVVNAARVSFAKESEYPLICMAGCGEHGHSPSDDCPYCEVGDLNDRDKKLISYLAKHGHWTPFGHPQVTLHIKVPIFVARQLHKHQVGFVVNEVSRRYVDEEPEFYTPTDDRYRKRAENKKQGSSDETVWWVTHDYLDSCLFEYREMISHGIAPEQARMVLPLSTYTEFYMTGSLAAWSRLYNLRIQPDAQKEVQVVAKQIGQIIEPLFPVSWRALNESNT